MRSLNPMQAVFIRPALIFMDVIRRLEVADTVRA
jgi:hypothetical protein